MLTSVGTTEPANDVVLPVNVDSVMLRASEMDMFASVARKFDVLGDVVVPVNIDSVMLRMSEMDMFASVASDGVTSDGVVPVNIDSVMLRMSDRDISLFGLIE